MHYIHGLVTAIFGIMHGQGYGRLTIHAYDMIMQSRTARTSSDGACFVTAAVDHYKLLHSFYVNGGH